MNQEEKITQKVPWYEFFLRENNIVRDIIIVIIAVFLSALLTINHRQFLSKQKNQEGQPQENIIQPIDNFEEEKEEVEVIEPVIDISNWKIYRSQWYGFELKYPENWEKPVIQKAPRGSKWEYRYLFRKIETEENNPYSGFDVLVYNVRTVKEVMNTEEFPIKKEQNPEGENLCDNIEGHLIENENYPAEKIYIPESDICFNPALFYSLTRDQYIYNIVPVVKENYEIAENIQAEISKNLPEFFSVASSFNLIEIKRPKPAPPKPKITAPKPSAATKKDSQGRLICAKKNDKPSKSDKTKKKHLDMECCLDPDEYPNPWCYYPPEKYGKLLK